MDVLHKEAEQPGYFASARRPFVGLRPFAFEDARFYFGREEQIEALSQLLLTSQLISVVGSSGSGKSSLVRAGLLPQLSADPILASETWTWVEMRPGDAPIRNLASALARPNQTEGQSPHDVLAEAAADRIELRLLESSFGIRDSLDLLDDKPRRQLVVLVDQFEEIFRFADLREQHSLDPLQAAEQRDEATLFVQLLLAATSDPGCPCRIILTMRSDFIGECARFHGLSEAVTASQYLVPALTRDQRAASIRGPIKVAGGTIDHTLLQRLLNDTNEDLDQLPVLQHAMMRCWQHTAILNPDAPHLTLQDYANIGGIKNALAQHADELLAELQNGEPADGGRLVLGDITRRLFQCLTDTDGQGRTVRRPQMLGDLTAILTPDNTTPGDLAAAERAMRHVIAHFSNPDCSFLRAPPPEDMTDTSVIDIGHEALIRRWERLGGLDSTSWVRQEQQDAEHYRDLVRLANIGSLIEEKQLPIYEAWWEERQPNRAWAHRYSHGGDQLQDAKSVLDRSRVAIEARWRAEIMRRRLRWSAIAAGVVLLFAAGLAGLVIQRQNARAELRQASLAQGRLISMLGLEDLRLIDPHTALLVAVSGLKRYGLHQAVGPQQSGPRQIDLPPGSDAPELYLLAYAGLEQLREISVFKIPASFFGLALDQNGNLLTFFDHKLRTLSHSYLTDPAKLSSDAKDWLSSGQRVDLPYAANIESGPDGRLVLLANSSQTFLVDRKSGEVQQLIVPRRDGDPNGGSPRGGDPAGAGTLSRDGTLILTTTRNDNPRIWAIDSQKTPSSFHIIGTLPISNGTAAAISPDNQFLAIGAATGEIHIFQSNGVSGTYRELTTLDYPTSDPAEGSTHTHLVYMLTFDPTDPSLLLAAYQSSPARLYVWQQHRPIALPDSKDAFRIAFSPDGKLIAAPSEDHHTIRVWKTESLLSGELTPWVTTRSGESFFQVALDNNNRLIAGSQSGTIWQWNLRAPALSIDLPDDADNHVSADELSASRNGTTVRWDRAAGQYTINSSQPSILAKYLRPPANWGSQPNGKSQPPASAALSPDGAWLALSPPSGFILLYDLTREDGKPVAALGEPDTAWKTPAVFAEPPYSAQQPRRIEATAQEGSRLEPFVWRYFPTTEELIRFSCQNLPTSVDITTPEPSRMVSLPPEIRSELEGNIFPALERVMGGRPKQTSSRDVAAAACSIDAPG